MLKRRSSRLLYGVLFCSFLDPVAGQSPAPLRIDRNGPDVNVRFDTLQGYKYRLLRKLNFTDGTWSPLGASDYAAPTTGPAQLTDTNAINTTPKAFYSVQLVSCDQGLASNSSNALDYARALELCQTTTDTGTTPGVISAQFTLASGTGVAAVNSRSIRSSFGTANTPRAGDSLVVLSTGSAAAVGQTNPSYVAFEPGLNTNTSSAAPADWLAANNNAIPRPPSCPAPSGGTTVYNPVMLTLRVRVPMTARSFSISTKFFTPDYAEYVCSPYNDMFLVLLDSVYAGTPANPADKNIAAYDVNGSRFPVSAYLAMNSGAFTQCVNGSTGCSPGAVPGTTTTCVGTTGLAGTGYDSASVGKCSSNSLLGGSTGWLSVRGNVVPGEIITLRFVIWDTGDGTYDSTVLLDNFQWSTSTVTPGAFLESPQ